MSMFPIASVTVGAGGTTTVTFSSIPQTFTHLQIRGILFSATAGANFAAQFNGDTGANYKGHYLYGSGSAATSGVSSNTSGISVGYVSTANASYGDAFIFDILDYTNTNKYKTCRDLDGRDANGAGHIELFSGVWLNTAAITSITIASTGAPTAAQYSTFQLYGIQSSPTTGA
jgi:hypothetical protein